MYLRRNTRAKTEVSIDEPLNVDWEGNELLLSDILGTEADIISRDIEDEVDRDLLNKALERLSRREKKIVELRFGLYTGGEERTQKEVADMLGISQSYISRLEKKIISRLKKEMNRMVVE
jgi:RNA polymerase sporulation-specific sigma factor